MAEEMLPVAANLAVLVHGDGGPEDIQEVLDGLDEAQRAALIVVLAGLVDPDRPLGEALGWLDFDEAGGLAVPAWGDDRSVRDLAPELELVDDDHYVDRVAVGEYLAGRSVRLNVRERLAAVVAWVGQGRFYPELDALHGLTRGATSTFVSRTRKDFARRGEPFPTLRRPGAVHLSEADVLAIRKRSAAGATDLEIGMSYGVNHRVIGNICRGQHFAGYGGPIRSGRVGRQPSDGSRAFVGLGSVRGV
ncbi:hypothetical protein [Streptomyces sp. NPDC059076]|uniref:hypothetical protein n=1 Tax=unclassified Streptomyces TaxID=2593676 RepID=UPI0036AE7E36